MKLRDMEWCDNLIQRDGTAARTTAVDEVKMDEICIHVQYDVGLRANGVGYHLDIQFPNKRIEEYVPSFEDGKARAAMYRKNFWKLFMKKTFTSMGG